MKREDAIKLCRYYHGEKECKLKEPNEQMLWFCERAWVIETLKDDDDNFSELLSDYLNVGLIDFCNDDHVPITFKALLFNRYCKTAYSMSDAVKHFKEFYTKYYA